MTTPSFSPETTDVSHVSVADVQRLVAAQVSMPSRVWHVVLLVVALTIGATVGSLWATEPSLPLRTHIAFGLIVCGAAAWATFAVWVLTRRRVLFGADGVVAATIGLTLSTIGALGMTALGYRTAVGRGAYLAAAMHAALCAVAAFLLFRARRRVAALAERKRKLEDELRRARG